MLSLGFVESALEAWAECRPEGMALPEERLRQHLSVVAARLPGNVKDPEAASGLRGLFNSPLLSDEEDEADLQQEATPAFMRMVKPCAGQVHFLYFWQAFAEAARQVAGGGRDVDVEREEGPLGELPLLRDSIIRILESARQDDEAVQQVRIPTAAFVGAVHEAASVSKAESFWRAVRRSLVEIDSTTPEVGPEELAVIVLSWLHEAAAWQPPPLPPEPEEFLHGREEESEQGQEETASHELPSEYRPGRFAASLQPPREGPLALRRRRGGDADRGLQVYLHIYDVSQEEIVQKLNRVLAHKYSPLKFGGVFHAGVEVNGLEWSYGFSLSESVPGISCTEPKTHPQHHFRQTVCLRPTLLSAEDIADIMSQLIEEYPGDDYDLLRRNCCHFADDFCQRLGSGHIPGWVHRLARLGARLDGAFQVAQGIHEKVRGALQPAITRPEVGDRGELSDDDDDDASESFTMQHHEEMGESSGGR